MQAKAVITLEMREEDTLKERRRNLIQLRSPPNRDLPHPQWRIFAAKSIPVPGRRKPIKLTLSPAWWARWRSRQILSQNKSLMMSWLYPVTMTVLFKDRKRARPNRPEILSFFGRFVVFIPLDRSLGFFYRQHVKLWFEFSFSFSFYLSDKIKLTCQSVKRVPMKNSTFMISKYKRLHSLTQNYSKFLVTHFTSVNFGSNLISFQSSEKYSSSRLILVSRSNLSSGWFMSMSPREDDPVQRWIHPQMILYKDESIHRWYYP